MSKVTTIEYISSNYTIDTGFKSFVVDATSGDITITLPLINTLDGINFKITRVDLTTNIVTLDGNGANINGAATQQFLPNSNAQVASKNDEWYVTNGNLLPAVPILDSVASYRFFAMTVNQTVSGTTSETSLFSNSVSNIGTLTINPSGSPPIIIGRTIRMALLGIFSAALSTIVTFSIKLNSSIVVTSSITITSGIGAISNSPFEFRGYLTFHDVGVSGSALGNFSISTNKPTMGSISTSPSSPIDTTSPLTLDVTVTFSSSAAGNAATIANATCYLE